MLHQTTLSTLLTLLSEPNACGTQYAGYLRERHPRVEEVSTKQDPNPTQMYHTSLFYFTLTAEATLCHTPSQGILTREVCFRDDRQWWSNNCFKKEDVKVSFTFNFKKD